MKLGNILNILTAIKELQEKQASGKKLDWEEKHNLEEYLNMDIVELLK